MPESSGWFNPFLMKNAWIVIAYKSFLQLRFHAFQVPGQLRLSSTLKKMRE